MNWVLEHLTVDRLAIIFSLLASALAVLKVIANRTPTTVDDRIVDAAERAKAWVSEVAPDVWAVVEVLAATNKLEPAKKADEFMRRLEEAHIKVNGAVLPDAAKEHAAVRAAGMSAFDKLNGDPRAGAVS